jgi:transposase
MGRRGGSYPQELRARAVRLVEERAGDYPTQWTAILKVARELGCTSESLRRWVRQAERDQREARA